MLDEKSNVMMERPPPLKGGPLGLGDPNDKRLRKTESDIIIPKMVMEEATKKCSESFKVFLDCAKEAGLLVPLRCKQENDAKNVCMSEWLNNQELKREVTDKYLHERSYYRSTGKPLHKYERVKRVGGGFC